MATKQQQAKRLVIKIGSSTLTNERGGINEAYLAQLAKQVAAVRAAGWEVVVVSSGAIACGLESLKIDGPRPTDLPTLQAAASVGQGLFVSAYGRAFQQVGLLTSLVLLTRRDTADRQAYLHARDTMERLLQLGVVPVVNENDTVSVEQIKFGDNDTLAALVACLISADLSIIFSDVEGLFSANPALDQNAQLIKRVERIDEHILSIAGDAGTAMGSGGMMTKVRAARVLGVAGIPLVVCSGADPSVLPRIVEGEAVGTLFEAACPIHEITSRKLWIALGDSARGRIVVDAGAARALRTEGRSLLMVGAKAIEGDFDEGDIVDICDETGHLFARGRTSAASDVAELALGRTHGELERNKVLAPLAERPLVHRDDLVIFD